MKIAVVGAGYVGLANAFLIGISKKVTVVDIDDKKIELLKEGVMPINDKYIEEYKKKVNVVYTTNDLRTYNESDIIFIATNTDFDDETQHFNLKSIESVMKNIDEASSNSKIIVLKSTIPIGYTDRLQKEYPRHRIYFSPEFLRESYALYDNLFPDRIVVGGSDDSEKENIANLLMSNTLKDSVIPIVYTSNKEAEIIKLFANTYLAMRVSFVNELDTFCQELDLKTENVLDAIGHDHRIGRHYFNPSFGYGGYCLPKDSKQLHQEYLKNDIDSALMPAIVESNKKRKDFIAKQILKRTEKSSTIGIYRVVAKKGINNYRSAAILDIIEKLKCSDREIIIYAPLVNNDTFLGCRVENNLECFIEKSDIIVANRKDEQITDLDNIYTVDIYEEN